MQRVLVRREHYAAVKSALVERVAAFKQGDPRDVDTFIGPMIAESEAKRLEAWISEAKEAGASVLCGGVRDGAFLSAAVLENVPADAKVDTEEAFGPMLTLRPYDTFAEAVQIANDSKFGLQAGVFTSNMHKAEYAFEELEVGGVVINDVPSIRVDR